MSNKSIIITAIALALASCSQDDGIPGQGESLPDGKYSLCLTATVGSSQSRAGGKDYWEGGENIAVNVGDYTGMYTIHANGSTTASGSPYFWQNTSPATVRAWYPYAEGERTYDIADQSDGYSDFDFLYAEAEGSYVAPVHLAFVHQMAKVSYTLVKGPGITDNEFAAAKVTLFGDKSVTVSGGKITAAPTSQTDEIIPYYDTADNIGSAVMVPQNMTGKPLIKVSIGGNDFFYTPDSEATGNLFPACHYTYTITVKAHGIEVMAAMGGRWLDGGSEDVASKEVMQTYSASDLKPGGYYYADGTWSDGGLRKLYADGSTTQEAVQPNGKTVIGVVFYAGHHPNDQSDYSSTGINSEKCHGYVVALKDATADFCMWGPFDKELDCCPTDAGGTKLNNYTNPEIDWSGYEWSYKIISAAGGIGKLNETTESGYRATYYAVVAYETGCKASVNSSGWFLPSIGQLWSIYQLRSSLFDGKDMLITPKDDTYWCSSESHDSNAAICAFVVGWFSGYVAFHIKNDEGCCVRPILAF